MLEFTGIERASLRTVQFTENNDMWDDETDGEVDLITFAVPRGYSYRRGLFKIERCADE